MKRINITQAAAVFGVAGLLGVASLAIAGDQKKTKKVESVPAAPAFTNPASLPKFSHVVVVNSTAAQRAAFDAHAKTANTVGQRAYIDPVTLQLRPVTADDVVAEAAAANAAPAAAASSSPTVIALAGGGRAIALDDSSNAYSVAHIDSKGKVRQACVENQPNGEAALKASATIVEENSNEK